MFLAEPEPKFRLSRQHLCCHYNKLKMGVEIIVKSFRERHSPKWTKKRRRPLARIYKPFRWKGRRTLRAADRLPMSRHNTSHLTTEKIAFWTRIFRNFLLQKEKIRDLHKSQPLFSCAMMNALSFSLAIFNRYFTTGLVSPYFSIR